MAAMEMTVSHKTKDKDNLQTRRHSFEVAPTALAQTTRQSTNYVADTHLVSNSGLLFSRGRLVSLVKFIHSRKRTFYQVTVNFDICPPSLNLTKTESR